MIPELLAPAGSPEKLRYAFAYGADAVYAGIPKFSLRARENGFKDASLKEAIETTHKLGKKIYITANILPQNRKVDSFKKSLAFYAQARPDAFIMSDPGLIRFALKEFPQIPVHLSVQTNTMNWPSVEFWYDQGVRRVILSRELSLEEIREIHEKVPGMELEAFVHGSICIAYSGRCLLSNYFNHRDANQGTCTNSCRWEYNVHQEGENTSSCNSLEGNYFIEEAKRPGEMMPVDEDEHGTYIMNSKDLRAIEFLKELKDAGVMSFKMEGRSKSIYYLSLITKVYRTGLDDLSQNRSFNPGLLEEINKTANRGFTSAFLISNSNHATERFDSPQEDEQPQVFGGQVLGLRADGMMEVEVKNRMEVGEEVEYISPTNQYRFHINAMQDKKGNATSVAHGGNGKVWIQSEGPVEPYALLSLVKQPVADAVLNG
ncbi:MAG: U32 family peptidase [Nitrospinaceae bacterium]|nr:MAG: U32 family peptidase [Nitrospinaceae bacterium]